MSIEFKEGHEKEAVDVLYAIKEGKLPNVHFEHIASTEFDPKVLRIYRVAKPMIKFVYNLIGKNNDSK